MSTPPRKTIMRSLGEFFGHIAHAVRTDAAGNARAQGETQGKDTGGTPVPPSNTAGPAVPPPALVRQTVEEKQVETPAGPVTLRRTVIDEVELPPDRARGE